MEIRSAERNLILVISRADLLIPSGIRVNASGTKLYVTDSSATDSFPSFRGAGATGSPAIFVYDLDDDAFPVNKYMLWHFTLWYSGRFTLTMRTEFAPASLRKL